MKPIAENHITITQELFDEGMRAIRNKNYKKLILKFISAFILLNIAVAFYIIYSGINPIYLAGEIIFFIGIIIWSIFVLPQTIRRKNYKAMQKDSSEIPTRTVDFFENYLLVTSNTGTEVSISYKDVINWQETKHLWIIRCKNNLSILIKKDGFSIGNINIVQSAVNKELNDE